MDREPHATRQTPDAGRGPAAGRGAGKRRTRGQSLAEFALILPVLLLILLIGIDFGRVYLGWVELNNAARVGANYAALHPTSWDSPGNADDQAAYESAILADAAAINCTLPTPLPTPTFPDGSVLGGRAEVDLTCSFDLITPFLGNNPFFGSLLPDPLPVSAQAVFPIRAGSVADVPLGGGLPAPVAKFTGSPLSGPAPLTVNFTDQSTNSPVGWAWDFGDGGTSPFQNPSYSYTGPGTYTVTLTVTNAVGSDSEVKVGYVTVSPTPPDKPIADFTGTPQSGTSPLTVTFTDTSANNPTSWAWDFDNNGTIDSTSQNPTHTYGTAGTYDVKLTVSNAAGSDSVTKVGYIIVNAPLCTVPNLSGERVRKNAAQGIWTSYGFTTSLSYLPGNGNYVIGFQSLVGGSKESCDSAMTVGP